MHEAVTRRFQHYVDGDPGFCPLPDLLLIDGGTEHASVAQAVLDGFGLQVPVFGMVKDDRHRTRALITPGGHEIGIAANPAVFAFIGTIQEETHRFSIDYQRRLRRESLSSELDQIPGVGEKRRNALLKTFRSVKAIRAASYEELCAAVPAALPARSTTTITRKENRHARDHRHGPRPQAARAGGDGHPSHDR